MANMEYVTENKLTKEADQQKSLNQHRTLIIGGVISIATLFLHFYVTIFVALVTLVVWASQNGSEIIRAGAAGEDIAVEILKELPDGYTIYNQVDIPNEKSRTGFNEADLIVVGPNSIFVVEVKHNNGNIVGTYGDREWTVNKVGRGGTEYSNSMRNPIFQVKNVVRLLLEDMKKKKSRAWIQGIVLFSNDSAEISISGTSNIPVLRNDEFVEYILSYLSKSSISSLEKVVRDIAILKDPVRI